MEGDGLRFRPIGRRVLVLFPNGDWDVGPDGLIVQTGFAESGYRMDGMVMAVGTRDIPDWVKVGSTVYADPRAGRVVRIDGTRYHVMNADDLMAVAT